MNQVLDAAVLDDLAEHIGADAVREVIQLFIGECREFVAAMAASSATPEQARRAAHSLKSSAGQLGATALAEAAIAVEAAASDGSADLLELIAALTRCAARTEAALAERLD